MTQREGGGGRESEAVVTMRRDLGCQLAARRKAAGYLQRELATLVGYSRTAIANAETGGRSTLKWPHCSSLIWPHLGLVAVAV
jgi:DNA-binding XRE family transcriptional regulator